MLRDEGTGSRAAHPRPTPTAVTPMAPTALAPTALAPTAVTPTAPTWPPLPLWVRVWVRLRSWGARQALEVFYRALAYGGEPDLERSNK